ncbi:MAG: hypothetical protein ACFBZ8_08680 [Opitutales bacterium]
MTAAKPWTPDEWAARLAVAVVLPRVNELDNAGRFFRTHRLAIDFRAEGRSAGILMVGANPDKQASLALSFGSFQRLARALRGEKVVPLPTRGFWHIVGLLQIQKLTGRLEGLLHPEDQASLTTELVARQSRLLLRIALEGGAWLARKGEPWLRERLRDGPQGRVSFFIEGAVMGGPQVVAMGVGSLQVDGQPAHPSADASVTFASPALASAALRGQLDEVAAVGLGDIVIEGNAALADHLGYLLRRVDYYLEGRYE